MLFPTLRKNKVNANLLFSTRFNGVTLESPDSFAGKSCWRHISGTDAVTGFSYSDIAGPPLNVKPALGGGLIGYGGYGAWYLMQVTTFPSNDLAGQEAVCPSSISDAVIRGAAGKVLSCTWADTGPWFNSQVWVAFYRYLETSTPDLPDLCISAIITLPDLTTFMSSTIPGKRTLVVIDCKSGGPIGGDYRFAVSFIMANNNLSGTDFDELYRSDGTPVLAGSIGTVLLLDSNANHNAPFTVETFARMKNFDVEIPLNEPIKVSLIWHRSTSYNDLDTGWAKVTLEKMNGQTFTLFHVNKETVAEWNAKNPLMPAARPIFMGIEGLRMQRLMTGFYWGGKDNQLNLGLKHHGVDIYDGEP